MPKAATNKTGINENELVRLLELSRFEEEVFRSGYSRIAGTDEAGRGPLAGPLVAAACVLPRGYVLEGIDDSKKLSPKKRASLYSLLTSDAKVAYGVSIIGPKIIDEINIYQATIRAMLEAIQVLSPAPDYLLVDGMPLHHPEIPSQKIIKGDARSMSIAAASIIAKETRDKLLIGYEKEYPGYGFGKHKGYPTREHRLAIKQLGPSPIHRMSFRLAGL